MFNREERLRTRRHHITRVSQRHIDELEAAVQERDEYITNLTEVLVKSQNLFGGFENEVCKHTKEFETFRSDVFAKQQASRGLFDECKNLMDELTSSIDNMRGDIQAHDTERTGEHANWMLGFFGIYISKSKIIQFRASKEGPCRKTCFVVGLLFGG